MLLSQLPTTKTHFSANGATVRDNFLTQILLKKSGCIAFLVMNIETHTSDELSAIFYTWFINAFGDLQEINPETIDAGFDAIGKQIPPRERNPALFNLRFGISVLFYCPSTKVAIMSSLGWSRGFILYPERQRRPTFVQDLYHTCENPREVERILAKNKEMKERIPFCTETDLARFESGMLYYKHHGIALTGCFENTDLYTHWITTRPNTIYLGVIEDGTTICLATRGFWRIPKESLSNLKQGISNEEKVSILFESSKNPDLHKPDSGYRGARNILLLEISF